MNSKNIYYIDGNKSKIDDGKKDEKITEKEKKERKDRWEEMKKWVMGDMEPSARSINVVKKSTGKVNSAATENPDNSGWNKMKKWVMGGNVFGQKVSNDVTNGTNPPTEEIEITTVKQTTA